MTISIIIYALFYNIQINGATIGVQYGNADQIEVLQEKDNSVVMGHNTPFSRRLWRLRLRSKSIYYFRNRIFLDTKFPKPFRVRKFQIRILYVIIWCGSSCRCQVTFLSLVPKFVFNIPILIIQILLSF